MNFDVTELRDLAQELARAAGKIVSEGAETRSVVVATKSSAVDVVTETDRASETFIVNRLLSERPGDAILGEEGASHAGTSGVRWVIDPLDGTVNFTYGIPAYAVSIGVEADGVTVAGAVYNPATDEMFCAGQGLGATLNGSPLKVRGAPQLRKALVATGFGYSAERRSEQAATLQRVLPAVRDIRRAGSASLDMCSVAAGRLDGYFEFGVNPWDVMAGEIIAIEAGARVTAFDGGRPTNDVVAAHPGLQPELRRLVVS